MAERTTGDFDVMQVMPCEERRVNGRLDQGKEEKFVSKTDRTTILYLECHIHRYERAGKGSVKKCTREILQSKYGLL